MTVFGIPALTKKETKERKSKISHQSISGRPMLAHPRAPVHTNQQEKKYMKKVPVESPALVAKRTLLSGFPEDT